jgi:hypothetical protein
MSMSYSAGGSHRRARAPEEQPPWAFTGGVVPHREGQRATNVRSGLDPRRLAALIDAAVERCRLDLTGTIVLTEAACGAYVVTPVLAACAGADRVYAMTRSTSHGTVGEVASQTLELARLAGVRDRIEIVTGRPPSIVAQADIITNSGHVRPIDREMIGWMKPSAVVSLMHEAWELRPGDVDLQACRDRGILAAATDKRHPDVDVFSFLGLMAVKLLLDAHVAVYRSAILLLCDNPFSGFIVRGLRRVGATVVVAQSVASAPQQQRYDAILVALKPRHVPVVTAADAGVIACQWPGAVVAQFCGDLDRSTLGDLNVAVWPEKTPGAGHMGILPSAIGPEPVIRLLSGGLKVGELLSRGTPDPAHDCLQPIDGDLAERALPHI